MAAFHKELIRVHFAYVGLIYFVADYSKLHRQKEQHYSQNLISLLKSVHLVQQKYIFLYKLNKTQCNLLKKLYLTSAMQQQQPQSEQLYPYF